MTMVASGAIVNLNNITIADGSSAASGYYGGGVECFGTLTVTNSTFSGNFSGSYGGGIFNGGILTVTETTFSANSAGRAGAIWNDGTLIVTNSIFSANGNTNTFYGGGIVNEGRLTVTGSTFSGNSAGYGGGILNEEALTVTKDGSLVAKSRVPLSNVLGGVLANNFYSGISIGPDGSAYAAVFGGLVAWRPE